MHQNELYNISYTKVIELMKKKTIDCIQHNNIISYFSHLLMIQLIFLNYYQFSK